MLKRGFRLSNREREDHFVKDLPASSRDRILLEARSPWWGASVNPWSGLLSFPSGDLGVPLGSRWGRPLGKARAQPRARTPGAHASCRSFRARGGAARDSSAATHSHPKLRTRNPKPP